MRGSYASSSTFVQLVLEALHARLKSLDMLFLLHLGAFCRMLDLKLHQLHIFQLQLLLEHRAVAFEVLILLLQSHHFLPERFIINLLLAHLILVLLRCILSALIARSHCLLQVLLLFSI